MRATIIRYLNKNHEDEPRRPTFSSSLEARARAVVSRRDSETEDPVVAAVTDEIALTLNHIDQLRHLHGCLHNDVTRLECYTNTELIQMEARTPRYSPYRYPEREKLQRRLLELAKARRTLAVDEIHETAKLQQRLLTELGRRQVLDPH